MLLGVVLVAGVLYIRAGRAPLPVVETPATPKTIFTSQSDCEQKTGTICQFKMCDYVPVGMTPEEACPPNGPFKGWVSAPR